jgi:hypothetical protein
LTAVRFLTSNLTSAREIVGEIVAAPPGAVIDDAPEI